MTKKLILMIMVAVFAFESPVGVHAAYDGEKAADYAEKYAENRNSAYDDYSSDCTNFVSQCLYAGGLRDNSSFNYFTALYGVNNEKSRWYHERYIRFKTTLLGTWPMYDYKVSTTWVRVYNTGSGRGLYQYLVNVRGCQIAAFKQGAKYSKLSDLVKVAEVGDVIQCGQSADKLTHSVIVTGKKKDDLVVCYHSYDKRDASFKEKLWNQYSTFYVIKVK